MSVMQSIEHPRAPPARGIVRMDVFWSMWRSRTIPCPHGTGRPACETVLLHHEQFKIPENLARFAVRHGMTTFVKKMGPAVREFVADRRRRISPVRSRPCPPLPPLPLVAHVHMQALTMQSQRALFLAWAHRLVEPAIWLADQIAKHYRSSTDGVKESTATLLWSGSRGEMC